MSNCNIVMDLLPLYKENLLSKESKKFVEDHLKSCPECEKLLKGQIEVKRKESKPLDFVEKRIKKETRFITLAAIAFLGSILIFIVSYLHAPRHFEYEKDLYKVYKSDDIYTVEFSEKVSGIDYIDLDDSIYLGAYRTKYDEIFNKNSPKKAITIDKNNIKKVYYQNHESMPNMIIGSGDVRQTILPRLVFGFYAWISTISFIVIALVIFLRKKLGKKSLSLPVKTFLLGGPLSLLIGILSVKGFNTASYYPVTDFKYIALLSLGIYLFLIFLSIFRDQKRM